jgi:hypothetical protein
MRQAAGTASPCSLCRFPTCNHSRRGTALHRKAILHPLYMTLTIPDFIWLTVLFGTLQFLASRWVESRLKASIEHEYNQKLEDYRFEMRRREQAARVAKLLAMSFRNDIPVHDFNELAWELSLWLPADLVRELTRCLCGAPGAMNPKELLIAIRKQLHSKADDLTADQIVHRVEPHSQAKLVESLIKDPVAKGLSSP